MKQKILAVIDMQNDFISGSLGTKEAQLILPKVCEKIKLAKLDGKQIYFTRDTHQENYMETQEGKHLPVSHCIYGTDGWNLAKEIADLVETEDAVWDKNTFGSKELAKFFLQEHEKEPIEEIELIGLCTDICVISNALLWKAFLPEVSICVDSACCAGVTPESHTNALAAMKICQIEIR